MHMGVDKAALRQCTRLLSKASKPFVTYFLLSILAFLVAEPLSYYIHEYGHVSAANKYGWNYSVNYTSHMAYITDSAGIPYVAPTSVSAEGTMNATQEQLFTFYMNPLVLRFTIPSLMLFLMALVPAKRKNRYAEIFIAFLALWLLISASEYAHVFREPSDMWKLAHLFS